MLLIGHSPVLQALGWAVLNSLWQMALLWILFNLIVGCSRSISAGRKKLLATLLLTGGFAWFLFTFISIWTSESVSGTALINVSMGAASGAGWLNRWLETALPVASWMYLVLLIVPVFRFIRNYRFVRVLRHSGLSKPAVDWRLFVNRTAGLMGIRKNVQLWVSSLITSPVTIGYLKPVILIPLSALSQLSPAQLEAVLLHELAHIRRYDYLVNLVINAVQTILYFNPFVQLFAGVISKEREKSCDELVIQFQYDPHGYASALLTLQRNSHGLQQAMVLAAAGHKNELLHRVERILGVERKPVLTFNRLAGVLAGLLCIIAINAVLILSKPVTNTHALGFNQFTNPFFFFVDDKPVNGKQAAPRADLPLVAETNPAVPAATPAPVPAAPQSPVDPDSEASIVSANGASSPRSATTALMSAVTLPSIIQASYSFRQAPELAPLEEEHVKEVVAISKKVLEEQQWKEMQQEIADAFTRTEKEKLRNEYLREVEQIDWKKLEEKIAVAYEQINWERVNNELGEALAQIKLDSLQQEFQDAVNNLNKAQVWMQQNQSCHIPDTDLTLDSIRVKLLETKKNLEKVRAIRERRIIRL